jgi:hypothetical protein
MLAVMYPQRGPRLRKMKPPRIEHIDSFAAHGHGHGHGHTLAAHIAILPLVEHSVASPEDYYRKLRHFPGFQFCTGNCPSMNLLYFVRQPDENHALLNSNSSSSHSTHSVGDMYHAISNSNQNASRAISAHTKKLDPDVLGHKKNRTRDVLHTSPACLPRRLKCEQTTKRSLPCGKEDFVLAHTGSGWGRIRKSCSGAFHA